MLNAIIRTSLTYCLPVAAVAAFLLGFGAWEILELPIDLFPDLNRPRVTIMTETPGMAPEEVETLVTFPIEAALNGATGVQAVRSRSAVGVSIVWVEFDWGSDVLDDRQIVNERLALVADILPEGIKPQLAPISSITGQIMIIGLRSKTGETSPMELRTFADWDVRQRLLPIEGVAQVFTVGGERKQFQVLVDPDKLIHYGVTLHEVHVALEQSNANVTGGYLDEQGAKQLLVRAIGRIESTDDLRKLVVKTGVDRPILLEQVAEVIEGPEVKVGDAAAFVRNDRGGFDGGPSVLLTVNKQPGADTRHVTEDVIKALAELQITLPDDVVVYPTLYQQKAFIDRAIENVIEALRDGSILVVVILFIFLVNFRTTFITLTAIPLSVIITALVFRWFDMSINTMTLGGLAVAIGELVDDAIVDVENIFRRLRDNRRLDKPLPSVVVVYRASVEVRNSIVFGTLIVVLVFIPLFGLGGMEGRLFTPLAIAYIVSILSSLLVSLTVTPVLSYWLLPNARAVVRDEEGPLLRLLKWTASRLIRIALRYRRTVLTLATIVVMAAGIVFWHLERDFLPKFDEGVVQLNAVMETGTSLETSKRVARNLEKRLREVDGITAISAKTGRAELDEHVIGVNTTEFIISVDSNKGRSRKETLEEIRKVVAEFEGVATSVEQPLAHLITHMISGVAADVAIKLYGDDLDVLQKNALKIEAAIKAVDGVIDLKVQPQITIPQLRITLDRDRLAFYGLTPGDVNEMIETAMHGRVLSQVLIGQRQFDLLVRLNEQSREDIESLRRLALTLPGGGSTTLGTVATLEATAGPSTIKRERVRRHTVIECNVTGRGLVDVVDDIQKAIGPISQELPNGYFVELGGQFESQQSASRTIVLLFIVSLAGIFLVLYTMFRSANFAWQVMAALPMAFIGAVAALVITDQTVTVAALVGFISLCGIASRNGILLLNHYLYLVRNEGQTFSPEMIIRAGKERLAPVLMTALTSGIGLVPLALAAGEPGKEILYPVATVIVGGLISSTLLEFLVRPALFWTFGCEAGRRLVENRNDEVELR